MSLPELFLDRLHTIVPATELSAVLGSFDCQKKTAFRINTLKCQVDEMDQKLNELNVPAERIPWIDTARVVENEDRETITRSELVNRGEIFVQGLSSMLAPIVLEPVPGETVMDLAAAPGAKSTQIAAMMENQGLLSCVEVVKKRMYLLADNLKRCGVTIAKTYLTDGRSVGRKTPERFDRILLDAPCSGEARFQKSDPGSWHFWSERKIREQSRKQVGLIRSAWLALKPGGTLVYSTCSFAPEENERVVASLLEQFADEAEMQEIDLPLKNIQRGLVSFDEHQWPHEVERCVRILPNECMDGFFIAKIKKKF